MKETDDLFTLIKSLSKSEKRYYRLFTSIQSGDKSYIKLFDFIDKNKTAENSLSNIIGSKKKLADTKYYLYNNILKSLEVFHSNSGKATIHASQMNYIRILIKKGLYSQAEKIIKKSKKVATLYEQPSPLLDVLYNELSLMRHKVYADISKKEKLKLDTEIYDAIDKLKNSTDYQILASNMYFDRKERIISRNNTDSKIEAKILKDDLLKSVDKAKTYDAKLFFYNIQNMYYTGKNNYEKEYYYDKKAMELMEQSPHMITLNPLNYATAINNILEGLNMLKKYSEMPFFIKKMKSITINSEQMKNYVFTSANIAELNLYIKTEEYKKGLVLAGQIEKELKKINYTILSNEKKIKLYYHLAGIFFCAKEYASAKRFLNLIINIRTDVGNDYQCFARITNLILHFEMGNTELLEYNVKSAYRFLYKRNRLYKFESIILNFIRKEMSKIHSPKQMIAAFVELKTKLLPLSKNTFEKKALYLFYPDIISWLDGWIKKDNATIKKLL